MIDRQKFRQYHQNKMLISPASLVNESVVHNIFLQIRHQKF